ncbi:helix-turn-helix domain-containing protein [Pedobacter foliorum]|uniref:helix-turn-helix domain-containing protein n=1 Tax=Pedobacter foliorum TaxID=2739058 RepID=UPI00156739C8|nr:helix-turn-helix transcriptional regulator [Pedobacter foliorum]NRF37527.1 helix-turn-helix transcriptional regulator [Pedobacter foliorum]
MNDISYIHSNSDIAILKQIGQFIKEKRIEKNINQNSLADNAAISRSTLSLIERGDSISLVNLIKILRILDTLYVLERFRTEPQISPMLLAKEEQKKRKRVLRAKNNPKNEDLGW